MDQLKIIYRDWPHRKVANELGVLDRKVLHGPDACRLRYGIKPLEILEPNTSAIMVAANCREHMLAHPIGHTIRVGPITHQVAATEDSIILAGRVFQHSLQSFPVAM